MLRRVRGRGCTLVDIAPPSTSTRKRQTSRKQEVDTAGSSSFTMPKKEGMAGFLGLSTAHVANESDSKWGLGRGWVGWVPGRG